MPDTGIDAIRELLHAEPRPEGLDGRRKRLDRIGSAYPVASDISFETGRIGDLPIEWSLAPGSDASRVLLYFHGGGYSSGSIASHRGMVVEAGRAAGVRTLAVGYRLAPENTFPAALEDARAAYAFLLEKGFAPPRIALGGDSAGGGL
ncbi:MAG TPA: alpha/beta hydrolase fold domain-containing protein, partial [Methylocella sp.]|nr:alpha/beta hydrolase fold domain-containing protein [Methylocella sp.]